MSKRKQREYDAIFKKATSLRDAGQSRAALRYLTEAMRHSPQLPTAYLIAAHIHWEMGHLTSAIKLAKKVTTLSPKNELGSFMLFQAYWDNRNRPAAIKELRRFVTLTKSDQYAFFIEEVVENEENQETKDRLLRIAQNIRLGRYARPNKSLQRTRPRALARRSRPAARR